MKKEQLKIALETVRPALASKEVFEQATSFAFLNNRVVTFNNEIMISHPIEDLEISGAIEAETFYNLLSKVKSDEITIETNENEILVSSGKMKAGLRLQTNIVLPISEVDQAGKWKNLPPNFCDALSFVKNSCSSKPNESILQCVHIKCDSCEASDGFCIAQFLFDKRIDKIDILIPAESVNQVIKIKPKLFSLTERWIHFKNENDTVISCRLVWDRFPNTEEHMKVDGIQITLPQTIIEILDRAGVFTKKAGIFDQLLNVTMENNRLKVHGKSDSGWFEETANIKFKEDTTTFKITPSLLRDILSRSNTCVLGKSKILFQDAEWQYMALLFEN